MKTDLSPDESSFLDAYLSLKKREMLETLLQMKRTGQPSPLPELFPNRVWLGSVELLEYFFDLLQRDQYRFIKKNESWDNFKTIFLTGGQFTPVCWKGAATQLVDIFDQFWKLEDLDDIPLIAGLYKDVRHVFIQKRFYNEHGKEFSLRTLRTSLSKGVNKPEHITAVEGLVKSIEKQWAIEKIQSVSTRKSGKSNI